MDLLEQLKRRQQQSAQAEKLNEILSRPDSDFLTYGKDGRSIGAMMRWKGCPHWLWGAWKAIVSRLLDVRWQERRRPR